MHVVGRYFGLLAVTSGYHWLPALPGFGNVCRILLYFKFSYPQLFRLPLVTSVTMSWAACVTLSYLQVTTGNQRYQVLGMCACNMWLDVTTGYQQLPECVTLLWVTCSYFRLPLVTSVTSFWECEHVT